MSLTFVLISWCKLVGDVMLLFAFMLLVKMHEMHDASELHVDCAFVFSVYVAGHVCNMFALLGVVSLFEIRKSLCSHLFLLWSQDA